ncbi:hypothetical protein ACSFA8_00835 [Variovorax sp. RT4R15]|uniref:hypothetical protein n=1 Tax=Variovorax sp. RT4R15 TaxID=3443737 RepID=UPI003F44A928
MRIEARLTLLAALATALVSAHAESDFASATSGTLTATARLDFIVTIPRVLYLRVGTGTSFTSVGTVNLIDITVPAAAVGNGVAVAATGGDIGAGAVTVRVMGNGGNITLNSNTTGPLNNGVAAQQIGWNRINVASAPLASTTSGFNNSAITHPAFNTTGGAGTAVLLTASNKLVQQEGQWTYSYANTEAVAAGTYGGVGVNNGRVTYTASMP